MSLAYVAMLDYARQTASQTAAYIIREAQASPEPVVFVTGNSYMPPARSFSGADTIYWADLDLWDLYWETVETQLDAAQVMTNVPEWDNAIYAVDLARWEYTEDNDSPFDPEGFSGEWKPKEST